jgi:hypothetical protein
MVSNEIDGASVMNKRASVLARCLLVVAVCAAGCRSVAPPTLAPQGDAAYQQYNAQRFDPLPEPDSAPEIVGARGREYERPIAAPSRARWDPRTWVRRFGH